MRRCLTIAGSDSGGGAGIQADLKTFAAFGVFGTTAITAVTAQNTVEVTGLVEIPPDLVVAQIDAVAGDIGIDAAKTGMLSSGAIVLAVADAVAHHRIPNLVVDPVMVAKSGARLLRADAIEALRERLLPLAEIVTPNLPEAGVLAGIELKNEKGMREAARLIHALGPRAVVIKGGHLEGPDVVDLYYDGRCFEELRGERIDSWSTHGTGCTFAAALASGLALGSRPLDAVRRAKDYVAGAIRAAPRLGRGAGPLNHFHNLRRE
ncbi:MAG: bifunctional hydroxymethylpyrimidine kinase/phosphomethylpyrimidine kinase [Acidobacteria bacterium]|nr:bifunctional hydroxymethylpyrimidine kinase/phosphomethylpyrimidine kinase [Acidobacteriota bacterium]